jgi:predicted transcriptional regulator
MPKAIIEIPGPFAYFKQALATAARADSGERLPESDYHLGFADAAHLFAELTPARLGLVEALKGLGPVSIRALAAHLGRNYSNVHRDVTALLDLRLLARDDSGLVSVPWDAVEIHLALDGASVAA